MKNGMKSGLSQVSNEEYFQIHQGNRALRRPFFVHIKLHDNFWIELEEGNARKKPKILRVYFYNYCKDIFLRQSSMPQRETSSWNITDVLDCDIVVS